MRITWNVAGASFSAGLWRKVGLFALALALLSMASITAFAAGTPTLEIQSPAQNATVHGNAVRIDFRTHDFKVVSLKNFVAPGAHAASAAASSDSSGAPLSASQSSGSGQALGGMSPNYSGSTPSGAGANPESISPDASGMSQPASTPSVNPREGFVVVKVDDSPFFSFHTTSDPILVVFQQPGQHHVTLQLVTDDARPTGQPQTLTVTTGGAGAAPAAPQK